MKNSDQTFFSVHKGFDRIFQNLFDWEKESIKFSRNSNFPPTNIFIDEASKDIVFEIALAGYLKEFVNISFSGDTMTIQAEDRKVNDLKLHCIQRGIKRADINQRYIIPSSKYDTDKTEACFADGFLRLVIPAKDVIKPKNIQIK